MGVQKSGCPEIRGVQKSGQKSVASEPTKCGVRFSQSLAVRVLAQKQLRPLLRRETKSRRRQNR